MAKMFWLFKKSELFDPRWYRSQLHGFEKLQDPLWHYIIRGWKRQLSPSESFDPKYYESKYDDVRAARLNPLFHFLAYGQEERRLPLRSARETIDFYQPEAARLRTFLTPSLGSQRTSVLLDSSSELATGHSHQELICFAGRIAASLDTTLRVLVRGIDLDPQSSESAVSEFDEVFQQKIEITQVPLTPVYSDIPVFSDEISIATSLSSARAMQSMSKKENSWVLGLQKNWERLDHTAESKKFTKLVPPELGVVRNTGQARSETQAKSMNWPNSLTKSSPRVSLRPKHTGGTWSAVFHFDPLFEPDIYALGIRGISNWLLRSEANPEEIELTFLGQGLTPLEFLEEFRPTLRTHAAKTSENILAHCLVYFGSELDQSVTKALQSGIHVVWVSPAHGETSQHEGLALTKILASEAALGFGLNSIFQEFKQSGGE